MDVPYRAEYAKSGRSSCKFCRSNIQKDELRMAAMVQSPMFDAKIPNWYHFKCFFPKFKVNTEADISHFESLRWPDQEEIRSKISGGGSSAGTPASKGKKRKSTSTPTPNKNDFSTEYAKSSRSSCKGCQEQILKDEVRISKLDKESEKARRFGPHPAWYHVDCFSQVQAELEFYENASELPGFKSLSTEDQKMLTEKIKKLDVSPEKKPKVEIVDEAEKKALKDQSVLVYKYRDSLEKQLKKKEMVELLEYNNQEIPSGESRILDRLSDIMAFGSLEPCEECQGQLVFSNAGYNCTGNITEWSKCMNVTKQPKRRAFEIPEDFKEEYPFLNSYKYKKRERVFPSNQATPSTPKTFPSTSGIKRQPRPLENAKIVLIGKLETPKDSLKKTIARLGGIVVSQIDPTTACVITTKEDVEKKIKKIREAEANNVHVVSENIISAVEKGGLALMIKQYSLANWGSNPEDRINSATAEKKMKSNGKSDSTFSSGKSSTVKLTVKGGAAVEPESGLSDIAHVFEDKRGIYNAVLGKVEISTGTNSFYKLQLLQSDKGHNFWVFRSWGRVGTTIGGNKLEAFDTKQDGVLEFKNLYEEKTGTPWECRSTSKKVPNKFYPLDIDYGSNNDQVQKLQVGSGSKLHKSIQELICLIFDIEKMKSAMMEYEIDLKKMPLGKLSRKQIMAGYSILTELLDLIKQEDVKNKNSKLIDASNRFFTLIPHDFGTEVPPILGEEEIVKSKVEMLDFLLEVEIGFKLANIKEENSADSTNPIDKHYEQLKTKIEVLDKKSEEFQQLASYVKNTHAETHKNYELVVEDIFKVSRNGEAKRFKPFKQLQNRKLLWHGSRTTNMAGILSQGLRIAPPEAPVTGYMFGKGIYFADMVSKSANYCFASKENNTGILLLSEVALGDMYELTQAEHVTKLPNNKHSTKGLGLTFPDPSQSVFTEDKVEIPLGKPTKAKIQTSLLYNEFIVYDVAQVNIKYLLKLDFKFKY